MFLSQLGVGLSLQCCCVVVTVKSLDYSNENMSVNQKKRIDIKTYLGSKSGPISCTARSVCVVFWHGGRRVVVVDGRTIPIHFFYKFVRTPISRDC